MRKRLPVPRRASLMRRNARARKRAPQYAEQGPPLGPYADLGRRARVREPAIRASFPNRNPSDARVCAGAQIKERYRSSSSQARSRDRSAAAPACHSAAPCATGLTLLTDQPYFLARERLRSSLTARAGLLPRDPYLSSRASSGRRPPPPLDGAQSQEQQEPALYRARGARRGPAGRAGNCLRLSTRARHPSAGETLFFSAPFQFCRAAPEGNPKRRAVAAPRAATYGGPPARLRGHSPTQRPASGRPSWLREELTASQGLPRARSRPR